MTMFVPPSYTNINSVNWRERERERVFALDIQYMLSSYTVRMKCAGNAVNDIQRLKEIDSMLISLA